MSINAVSDNTLQNTYDWFVKARPEPDRKDFHSQLGVHFEEVKEMLDELDCEPASETERLRNEAQAAIHAFANHLKANDDVVTVSNPQAYLDAICDQIVTATGCAYISEFDLIGALDEVNHSNFSKFDENGNPIYDENKKVIKGSNYVKADLSTFI